MKFNLGERVSRGLVDNTLNSCTRWAEHRIVMPNPFPGAINFSHFPWQREILDIDEGFVTVRKAAQIGFSVAGIVRCLYVISQLKNDCLYVLPTAGLAGNFSKARIDTLVNGSPELHNIFAVDSVTLKKTRHNVNMHIVGSVSERNLVSNPVSSAIIDEYDRCAKNTYELVKQRLAGQHTKYLFSLSTPTLPEVGIDEQYLLGTKEAFFFRCPSCGKHETLRFPESVVICGEHMTDPDCERSHYICTQCKATLHHETKPEWLASAKWVPERTNVAGHRSFHINQLFAPNVTPGELVMDYHRSLLSDVAAVEFKNQKLGLAHLMAGARLSEGIINGCKDATYQLGEDRPENLDKMICMGIDVGTFLDVIITEFTYDKDPGPYPYEHSLARVLQAIRIPCEDWAQLDLLMREWLIQFAVVDFQPDTVNARRFCRRFRGYTAMCQYRRGTAGKEIKPVVDEHGIPTLTVDRTVFLDLALRRYHKGRVKIPGNMPGVFRNHMMEPRRTFELDELDMPRAVYKSFGDDHFAHASAYCEIAHMMGYTHSTGRAIQAGEAI